MTWRVFQYLSVLLEGEDIRKRLAYGSLVSFIIQGTGAGIIFTSEILLARILGTGGYGLYATVMAWLQVLVIVVLLGSNHLLLRFVPTYMEKAEWPLLRGLMQHCNRISLVLGVLLYASSVTILVLLNEQLSTQTRWAFVIGLGGLPIAALSLQRQAILRGLHRVVTALTPELIARPLVLIIGVLILSRWLKSSVSPAMALAANGLALMVAYMLGQYWQRCALPKVVRNSAIAATSKIWVGVALPFFLISGMQLLIVRLDIMLLGLFTSHEQAGHYAAASRIADVIVFALASANIIVAPLIAGMHARKDTLGMQNMLRILAKGVLFFTVPIVVAIVIYGKSILGLFGKGYEAAYIPLIILIFGQVVNALSGPVDFVMAMTGQQIRMMKILGLATVLNTVLNFALIPRFGLIGAGLATALTTIFWNLYMRRAVRKQLGIDTSVMTMLQKRI